MEFGGANLEIIAGVNWVSNQYFRLLPLDIILSFAIREKGKRIISELERAAIS